MAVVIYPINCAWMLYQLGLIVVISKKVPSLYYEPDLKEPIPAW